MYTVDDDRVYKIIGLTACVNVRAARCIQVQEVTCIVCIAYDARRLSGYA